MLRMLGCSLHSTYGPTADSGGLMQNHAPTIYAYPDLAALLDGEASGRGAGTLAGEGVCIHSPNVHSSQTLAGICRFF